MNVFVYGTLMEDEVVQSVLGRRFESLPAVLAGYRRVCLKQRVYPGIVKDSKPLEISGKARRHPQTSPTLD